jgi:hypothetical protein
MKNDAKLGLLAGVIGVIVSAVLCAGNRQAISSRSAPGGGQAVAEAAAPAAGLPAMSQAGTAALPSTSVIRTRREAGAQPASRAGRNDEEP